MLRWRREAIFDTYNLVLGLFLFLSPWLFAFSYEPARLESWASGFLLAAVAIAAIMAFSEWEEWITLFLGLWLIAAPCLLGFPQAASMKISIGVGIVVAYLALLELWLIHYGSSDDVRAG
jgi:hypothetical protein